MVDIKELMRTYVFINDPNVKEVTTKFGALLVVAAAIAVLAWGIVSVGTQGVPASDEDPSAAAAEDHENRECMNEEEFERVWKQEHADVVLAGAYELEVVDTGQLCVSW